jgi:hypothetical protein
MTRLLLVLALVLGTTAAQSQSYYGGCPNPDPERVINSLANAVMRVAPMFGRQQVHRPPETTGEAPSPSPSMSREPWKARLLAEGRKFCATYSDDPVCAGGKR